MCIDWLHAAIDLGIQWSKFEWEEGGGPGDALSCRVLAVEISYSATLSPAFSRLQCYRLHALICMLSSACSHLQSYRLMD